MVAVGLPHFARSHVPIALKVCPAKPLPLLVPRFFNPFLDLRRRFSQMIPCQLFVIYPRHLDMNVDAVEEWPADALLIAQHLRERAGALFHRVAVITTGTGILTMCGFV